MMWDTPMQCQAMIKPPRGRKQRCYFTAAGCYHKPTRDGCEVLYLCRDCWKVKGGDAL